jgi:hypothetical protein
MPQLDRAVLGSEVKTTEENRQAQPSYANGMKAIAAIVAVMLTAFLSVTSQRSSPPRDEMESPAQFSTGRAADDLNWIAAAPHPMGSVQNRLVGDQIRQRLRQLGLEVLDSRKINLESGTTSPYVLSIPENIVGRLPGTGGSKAVLLVAHYDSVESGPGASDNGYAVACILETLRALRARPRLSNDVIVLFADGEEYGALGSEVFAKQSAWKNKIGVVLNFDARGNRGPLLMYETGDNDAWAVTQMSLSGARPVATSLMGAIYRLLNLNGSDFKNFKARGFQGLNFAIINGIDAYHTRLDTVARDDLPTLHDMGDTMLKLVLQFGDADLTQLAERKDMAYFNPWGRSLIRYRAMTARISALVLIAAAIVMIVAVCRHRSCNAKSLIAGCLVALGVTIVGAGIAALILWTLNTFLTQQYPLLIYRYDGYIGALLAIAIALVAIAYRLGIRSFDLRVFALGASIPWLGLMAACSIYSPTANVLFTWTALPMLPAIWLVRVQAQAMASIAIACLECIALAIAAPTLWLMFCYMNIMALPVAALFGTTLFPLVGLIHSWRPRYLPWISSTTASGLLLFVIFSIHRTRLTPQPNHVFYFQDFDASRAMWCSADSGIDAYTEKLLSSHPEKSDLPKFLRSKVCHGTSPLVLEYPTVEVIARSTRGKIRELDLLVKVPAGASWVDGILSISQGLIEAQIEGIDISPGQDIRMSSFRFINVPSSGLHLHVVMRTDAVISMRILSQSYGLPRGADTAGLSDDQYMSSWTTNNRETVLSRTFAF